MYKGNINDDTIISMDNKKIYGDNIFTYNTHDAIIHNRLVDYQILSIYAKNEDIQKDIETNKLVKFKKEFTDKEV